MVGRALRITCSCEASVDHIVVVVTHAVCVLVACDTGSEVGSGDAVMVAAILLPAEGHIDVVITVASVNTTAASTVDSNQQVVGI